MTKEPAEIRLPPCEVVPPKSLWRFVITRVLAVAALGFIMAVGLNHSSKTVIAAAVFLLLMIVIAAAQVPLFQRRWRRLEENRLKSLPGDPIYAGPAARESPPGRVKGRPVAGELVLDSQGISFTPRRTQDMASLRIAWGQMTQIRLLPISTAPVAGSLELTLHGGATQSFVIQRCESLAAKLQRLTDHL